MNRRASRLGIDRAQTLFESFAATLEGFAECAEAVGQDGAGIILCDVVEIADEWACQVAW